MPWLSVKTNTSTCSIIGKNMICFNSSEPRKACNFTRSTLEKTSSLYPGRRASTKWSISREAKKWGSAKNHSIALGRRESNLSKICFQKWRVTRILLPSTHKKLCRISASNTRSGRVNLKFNYLLAKSIIIFLLYLKFKSPSSACTIQSPPTR